jgi:hypothetical protein
MEKHFIVDIQDTGLCYRRDADKIALEAALDGIYVIRTSVPASDLSAESTVILYKRLSVVERAFRSIKTVDLHVRPIGHYKAERVRSHVFLCMLAYYVEWHMRQALAPILFDDDDKPAGAALRNSVVAPSKPSPSAEYKAHHKQTRDGLRVHSFQTLLRDLGTLTRNRVRIGQSDATEFQKVTVPTPLQKRALDLLGITNAALLK